MSGYHRPTPVWMSTARPEILSGVGYHNYFMVGVFDAVANVQAVCPDGWRAGYTDGSGSPSIGAVRVGQVRVHSGDPDFILYVWPVALNPAYETPVEVERECREALELIETQKQRRIAAHRPHAAWEREQRTAAYLPIRRAMAEHDSLHLAQAIAVATEANRALALAEN